MRRSLPLASLALVCALVLAGCGGQSRTTNEDSAEDFKGAQQQVAQTIEDLQRAARERAGTRICGDLITAQLREDISSTNCGEVLKDAIRDTDEVDLVVKSVTIDGNSAVAQVQEKVGDDERRNRKIELEKVAGAWRISALPAPSG
jgi:hypothetical protein